MLGKMFIHACVLEGTTEPLLKNGDLAHLFKASEIPVVDFVRNFVKQYHKMPGEETIEAHTGETLTKSSEPPDYYLDLLKTRHVEHRLKAGMQEASNLLQTQSKDPEAALEKLTGAVLELAYKNNQQQMVDFRSAYAQIMQAYAAKYTAGDEYGLTLGWPTLDNMTGGLVPGDVLSLVGRPAQGKTWQLLYAAHHGWKNKADNHESEANGARLFVSMEMGIVPVQQRLAAMQAHVPVSGLKKAELTSHSLKKLKAGLTEIQTYADPFYVLDGNLHSTVEDIWLVAQQLKPGAIFIDGAYLLKHPTERDRFKRAAENADLIKSELASLSPTVASWQFARSSNKKGQNQNEKKGLEDIGYTDSIGQNSSVVLGLLQEESIETLNSRLIDILKGRNGEVGSFRTRWDFQGMNFDEILEQEVSELEFL